MAGEQGCIRIDEAYLYQYMPEVERWLMSRMPSEEELDHTFSRRFERKMKALIMYERRTPWERKFYRGMKIAFATIIMVLLVSLGSAMSVQAYRSKLIRFFVEVFEELTSFLGNDVSVVDDVLEPIEPEYVPKQYEKIGETVVETKCVFVYADAEGNTIRYKQELLSNPIHYLDSEDATYSVINIKGNEVIVYQEMNETILCWKDQTYYFNLTGSVSADELVKMTKSIMRNK